MQRRAGPPRCIWEARCAPRPVSGGRDSCKTRECIFYPNLKISTSASKAALLLELIVNGESKEAFVVAR